MPEFDDFDLRSELDKRAFQILEVGNSNLVFGGSSEQEAQVFGSQINSSDSVNVGAFLGGVALSNLKTQQANQQRFERIQSLNQQISERRRDQLNVDRFNEQQRSALVAERQNDTRIANDTRNTDSQIVDRQGRLEISERNAVVNESNQTFRETQASIENNLANRRLSETERNNTRQNILSQQDNILKAENNLEKEKRSVLLLRDLGVPDEQIVEARNAGTLVGIAQGLRTNDIRSTANGRSTTNSGRSDPAATPSITQDGFRNLGAR